MGTKTRDQRSSVRSFSVNSPTFSTQWEIDLVFPSMPSQQSCLAKLVKLSAKQRTGPFLSTLLAPTVRNLFARVPKKTQFLVGLSILLNVWEPTCSTVNPLKSWGRKTLSLFGKRVKYQLNCYDKVLTECVTWIVRVNIFGNDFKAFLDHQKGCRSISYHQIDFADTTNLHFHPLL